MTPRPSKPVVVKATAEAEPSGKDSLRTTTTRIGKGKQQLRDIPQSVTVVTEKLMDDRKIDTVKEALKMTSGVTFLAAEGGEEDIRLRGFPLNTTGDLFIDGMRDPAFYDRDTFNMDRIEVLRGSRVDALRPRLHRRRGQPGQQAGQAGRREPDRPDLGSHQYRRVVADVNVKTGDDSALRINAMRTQADNNGAGTSLDKYGVAADYRWGIGSATSSSRPVLLPAERQRHQLRPALDPQERHQPGAAPPSPLDPSSYYGTRSDYNHGSASYATFAHTHRFPADTELVTKIRRAIQPATSAPAPCALPAPRATRRRARHPRDPSSRHRAHPRHQTRSRASTTCSPRATCPPSSRPPGLKHEVLTGVDACHEESSADRTAASQGGASIPNRPPPSAPGRPAGRTRTPARSARTASSRARLAGVYAQDLIQVRPHWKFLAGLRYDGMSAQSRQSSTPTPAPSPLPAGHLQDEPNRFGLLYQPSDRHPSTSPRHLVQHLGRHLFLQRPTVNTPREEHERRTRRQDRLADRRMSSRLALFRAVKLNERNTDPLLQHRSAVRQAPRHRLRDDVIGRSPRAGVLRPYTWIWDAEIDKGRDGAEGHGQRPSLIPKHQGGPVEHLPGQRELRSGGAGANARTCMTPNRNPGPVFRRLHHLRRDGRIRSHPGQADPQGQLDQHLTNKFYADSVLQRALRPGFGRTVYITGTLKF